MDRPLGPSVGFGPFRLYPSARTIEKDGVRLMLGSRAVDVLIVLVENAGKVVGHRELTERVWRGLVVTASSLRVHVASLRKALGDVDGRTYIANVPGQGYCFVAAIEAASADVPRGGAGPRAAPRGNLPHPITRFVGRALARDELAARLAATRLLTLVGAGGCGKTRLALQVATDVDRDFPDGGWLVELAPLSDAALVARTVAKVLDVKETPGESLADTIAERLATKRMLLVLDNAEHLLEACAALVELLLRRCASLRVLVTSREPLGLGGEATWRVPSLSVPAPDATQPGAVLDSEAAQLFVDRVRLHLPDFDVTPANAHAVASICRRVDGMALALELAATRMRTMSIEDLDRQLIDRFALLTEGNRGAMPRHRTLRSLIDWSHDLLCADEQTMLRRLAVFEGGLEVDAAAWVCVDDGMDRAQAQRLLSSLADKSLVAVVDDAPPGSTRYRMLDTVRQYALEKLRSHGEVAALRARHFDFYLSLAEALARPQSEQDIEARLQRLDRDLDNLRSALAWGAEEPARAAAGLRLAGKLAWLWMVRGHHSEGREWNERYLAAAPDADDEDRAKALATIGVMAYHQDDYERAAACNEAALRIYRRLGMREQMSTMILNLGAIEVNRGHHRRASDLFEESLAIEREIGDQRGMALLLTNLSVLACCMDDVERAGRLLEECVPISREAGKWSASHALQQLGWVRHVQGRSDEARELLAEALAMQRELDAKLRIATTLQCMGVVSHDLGDLDGAKAQLHEALGLLQATGDRILTTSTLEALGGLAACSAGPLQAARLWGAAEQLRERIGFATEPALARRRERQVSDARAACRDDSGFDAAWREGRAMRLDAAIRTALAL